MNTNRFSHVQIIQFRSQECCACLLPINESWLGPSLWRWRWWGEAGRLFSFYTTCPIESTHMWYKQRKEGLLPTHSHTQETDHAWFDVFFPTVKNWWPRLSVLSTNAKTSVLFPTPNGRMPLTSLPWFWRNSTSCCEKVVMEIDLTLWGGLRPLLGHRNKMSSEI